MISKESVIIALIEIGSSRRKIVGVDGGAELERRRIRANITHFGETRGNPTAKLTGDDFTVTRPKDKNKFGVKPEPGPMSISTNVA